MIIKLNYFFFIIIISCKGILCLLSVKGRVQCLAGQLPQMSRQVSINCYTTRVYKKELQIIFFSFFRGGTFIFVDIVCRQNIAQKLILYIRLRDLMQLIFFCAELGIEKERNPSPAVAVQLGTYISRGYISTADGASLLSNWFI